MLRCLLNIITGQPHSPFIRDCPQGLIPLLQPDAVRDPAAEVFCSHCLLLPCSPSLILSQELVPQLSLQSSINPLASLCPGGFVCHLLAQQPAKCSSWARLTVDIQLFFLTPEQQKSEAQGSTIISGCLLTYLSSNPVCTCEKFSGNSSFVSTPYQ